MATKKDYVGYAIRDNGDTIGFINLDKEIDPTSLDIKLVIEGIELELALITKSEKKSRFRKKSSSKTVSI